MIGPAVARKAMSDSNRRARPAIAEGEAKPPDLRAILRRLKKRQATLPLI
jgi:hypothetical protein